MFNLGSKKDLIQRLRVKVASKKRIQGLEQMNSQVRKVMAQKGLILMARG